MRLYPNPLKTNEIRPHLAFGCSPQYAASRRRKVEMMVEREKRMVAILTKYRSQRDKRYKPPHIAASCVFNKGLYRHEHFCDGYAEEDHRRAATALAHGLKLEGELVGGLIENQNGFNDDYAWVLVQCDGAR